MIKALDLEELSSADFMPLLGSSFAFKGEGGTVISTRLLSCVESVASTMPGSPRRAFTLILEATDAVAPTLRGGSFLLQHDAMGTIGPLHVERILSVTAGTRLPAFQVIFN